MSDIKMYRELTRPRKQPCARVDTTVFARQGNISVLQGRRWRDTSKRRRRLVSLEPGPRVVWWMALLCLLTFISPTTAALLEFDNCLDKSILESNPLQLQFIPLDVAASFNLADPLHPLNVTIYGNVSGTTDGSTYNYSPNDPQWTNSSSTYGKIYDLSKKTNKYTTLLTDFDVLNFLPWHNGTPFCSTLTQGECPLGPVFNGNTYAHYFFSPGSSQGNGLIQANSYF